MTDEIKQNQTEGFNGKEFRTTSISLAATLEALGYHASVESIAGRHIRTFVFKEDKALRKAIDKFWIKELAVEPRSVLDAYELLKSRVRVS